MRGLVFDASVPRQALLAAMSRFAKDAATGRASLLQYRDDIPEPRLRGTRWARLTTHLGGISGSDILAVEGRTSPALSPFSSFPCVPGHEILGEVEDAPLESHGSGSPGGHGGAAELRAKPIRRGDRVIVEPVLPCRVRELRPCARCQDGHYCQCESTTRGDLAPGMFLGSNRDLPGGWGESVVAHDSMLFRVPDALTDEEAVLVEPLAVGYRAVLRHTPESGERILVIGDGTLAMAVLAAVARHAPKSEVASASQTPFAAQAARELGAEAFDTSRVSFDEVVTRYTGARSHRPVMGRDVYQGGFDVVYDCVGSEETLGDALRGTRAGGRVVLVGPAGEERVDWTFVWARELTVAGVVGYGWERIDGQNRRTFDVVLDDLAATRPPAIRHLVTHRHRIEGWRDAIRANQRRASTGALKTVFDFR